ncbi:unnamed protein product, partial [Cladocopium goreaui]
VLSHPSRGGAMSQAAANARGLEERPRRTGVSNARLLLRAMLSLETSKCGESSSLQRLSALCCRFRSSLRSLRKMHCKGQHALFPGQHWHDVCRYGHCHARPNVLWGSGRTGRHVRLSQQRGDGGFHGLVEWDAFSDEFV